MSKNAPYIAEFIGTFSLCLVVILSLLGNFVLPVPVVAAMTLGLFVYSIGHISGTHINPAITLGLLSIKKIKPDVAMGYVVAQILGAGLAMGVGRLLGIPALDLPTTSMMLGVAEAVGVFFFSFGVAAVVMNKVDKSMSGVVVGSSLLLGIIIASALGSGGILNPAVTLAVHVFSPMYIVGQILGAVLGFNCYIWLDKMIGGK